MRTNAWEIILKVIIVTVAAIAGALGAVSM